MKLEFSEGNVIASYKGLTFSVPQSAVPVKAMMLNLIMAVDDNAKLEELTFEDTLDLEETLSKYDFDLDDYSEFKKIVPESTRPFYGH